MRLAEVVVVEEEAEEVRMAKVEGEARAESGSAPRSTMQCREAASPCDAALFARASRW
jgi:hypothetical protein